MFTHLFLSNYWYDAAGERTVKTFGDAQGVSVNGLTSAATTGTTNFTTYISPYIVIGNGGQMSKHIYIGSQRVISKLIDGGTMADPTQAPKVASVDYTVKYADLVNKMKVRYDSLGVTYRGTDNRSSFYKQVSSPDSENQQYFFHSDHLGSSSLVTDLSGNVAQHIEYVPFGEVFVEERNNSWSTPYKFNAKELDEETGLYYYGARYYNPRSSVWLSVDPLAEKYPNISSYVYCADNPVKFIDPDGRKLIFIVRGDARSQDRQFTYCKGNFFENGRRYNPGKESLSPTIYKVLKAYLDIEKSNDKVLKAQLHRLENSKEKHYMEKSPWGENNVRSLNQDNSDSGKPSGTQAQFDFSSKKESLATIVHEMRHQFDFEIGNVKDDQTENTVKDPSEIRAVYNENRANDILNKDHRTTYGDEKIDTDKLNNPPNNKQVNDAQK